MSSLYAVESGVIDRIFGAAQPLLLDAIEFAFCREGSVASAEVVVDSDTVSTLGLAPRLAEADGFIRSCSAEYRPALSSEL